MIHVNADMLNMLYERYQRELYLYLCALCNNETIAEDLLQETFLRALLSLPDENVNVRAWLYQVARNLYFDLRKRDKVRMEHLHSETEDGSSGPLENVLRDETHRILYYALSMLDERKREVLELHYFSGLSQREIANILQIKPDYVRVLAHRAKLELRNWMEEHGYDIS